MLYVLTLADLAAVGPGVLNDWKQQLLTDLYEHTLRLLAERFARRGVATSGSSGGARSCWTLARRLDGVAWWETQIARPAGQLPVRGPAGRKSSPSSTASASCRVSDAVAWGQLPPGSQRRRVHRRHVRGDHARHVSQAHRSARPARGTQILSAEINTLADGLVLDRFYVQDPDFAGQPPADRIEQVCQALVAALKDRRRQSPSSASSGNERKAATARPFGTCRRG